MPELATKEAPPMARWSVGGIFLEALATRDYERMATTLASSIRFRALLPPGLMQSQGPPQVVEAFRSWFGHATDYELIDATVGEIGGRLHLSWRIRLRPAPFGTGQGWHVIEQHAYADAADSMEALDLLCSGFHVEGTHPGLNRVTTTIENTQEGAGDDSNSGHRRARGQGQRHVPPCGPAAP